MLLSAHLEGLRTGLAPIEMHALAIPERTPLDGLQVVIWRPRGARFLQSLDYGAVKGGSLVEFDGVGATYELAEAALDKAGEVLMRDYFANRLDGAEGSYSERGRALQVFALSEVWWIGRGRKA